MELHIKVGIFVKTFSFGFEYNKRAVYNSDHIIIKIEKGDSIAVLDRKGKSRKLIVNATRHT